MRAESEKKPQGGKYAGVMVACLLVVATAMLSAYLCPSCNKFVQVHHEQHEAKLRVKSLGQPDALINFAEFSRQLGVADQQLVTRSPLEHSRRSLLFTSNLASIGQHNLWALTRDASREATYFIGQTPFSAYLTQGEQSGIMSSVQRDRALIEMLAAGSSLDGPVSNAPSGPGGPGLETSYGLTRWFKRITKSSSYFDIPNFPLDQQPDPAHVTHIDADLRACTDRIKNQRSCGACYAFSFVSLAEWHLCMQTGGKLVDLSEQYIIDCGHKTKLEGCKEGRLSYVRKFVQFFGMKYERDQEYHASEKKCTNEMMNDNKLLKLKIFDWRRVKIDREVFEKTLEEQPIVLEVHLPKDFMSYSRGVHPSHNCNEKMGHGMLLVGYGRQDGVPYWLLRNSYGDKWGENGYARLSRDMPDMRRCFASGFVGKFKFAHVDEDNYQDLYGQMRYDPPEDDAVTNGGDGKLVEWLKGGAGDNSAAST